MTGKLSCNIKLLTLSLLILTFSTGILYAQVSVIGGQINLYGKVTAIGPGNDNVTISDNLQFSYFKTGDTVLLIQMKGAECLVPENSNYGDYQTSVGTTGAYEFLTILSVGAGNKITFRNNIIKSYNVLGNVQLVRVPSRFAAKVDTEIYCQAWDSLSMTGGVIALIVGTKLTLNANINARGKGFAGGAAVIGLGNCIESGGGLNNFSYPNSWTNSGLKGESLVFKAYLSGTVQNPIYPGYAKGYGANFTGGGGGSGRFSGGGGGSLVGTGGKGGLEANACSTREYGGIGGKSSILLSASNLYLGGGGGGSTYLPGATPSSGGKGGGIVIIVCETLDGNGYNILAEGETPAGSSGNAGSGGGGGGGTLSLYLSSFSATNITLSAKGGTGGNNASSFGEGGGGGGGRLNISNITIPGNVTRTFSGGSYGTRTGIGHDALAGTAGESLTSFVPLLNGFLFNSIRSSVTLNQIDSICSNVVPPPITGTDPVGGSGTYSYTWQRKYSLAGISSLISGANSKNYTPAATEANTFWVRRIVRDDVTTLTDTSKWVNMIVQPAITGNLIGNDTTICYGQNPHKIRPLNAGPSNGNGHYVYQWFSNNDNTTWTTNASGTSTLSYYDPSALFATTYYERKVTSGRCVNNSATISIIVLPSITGNITARPDSVICQGSLFNTLSASAAGNGSGSYIYQWQDSISSSLNFLPASGANNAATYSADTSDFTPISIEDRYYRRVVYSGLNNTCISKSVPIHLKRYHKIENNIIAADQTICSGSTPAALTGLLPIRGKVGDYTYMWQDSSKAATWTTRLTLPANTSYSPFALTDSAWYRRIVNSSKCTNNSNKIVINVHKPIGNNVASFLSGPGPDTTVCYNAIPRRIKGSVPTGGTNIPGSYAYLWEYSTDGTNYTGIAVSGTLKDYQPAALTQTTWFRRQAISGMCSSLSNSMRVIVLSPISGNTITVDKSFICYNTIPLPVTTSLAVTGGNGTYTWLWQQSSDGVTWTTAAGTSNQQSYAPPALTVKTWYRRIAKSGLYSCCIDTSNVVTIDLYSLPTGIITSVADTTLCSGGTVKLRITLTGSPNWTVVYNENSTQVTVSGISTSNTIISRIPSVSGTMTTFNYSFASVTDNHSCVATSLAGTRKADVYHTPVANAGPDDEVCGPVYQLDATPTFGTGSWTFPTQVLSGTASNPTTLVKIDSSFSTANVSYWFLWKETNWLCTSKDSVYITFDNRIDTINAGPGGEIMTFDNIAKVDAYPLLTYQTGLWSVVEGNGDFEDNTASSTYVRNIVTGDNIFKWSVKNGQCSLEDTLLFKVIQLVIPEGISPNNDNNHLNEALKITGLDLTIQDVDLKILNGAGSLVFTTTNRNGRVWTDWTGNDSKGALLSEGTYYYLLNVTSRKTGHVAKVSGFVILKRH
jgi:hypothetical protein